MISSSVTKTLAARLNDIVVKHIFICVLHIGSTFVFPFHVLVPKIISLFFLSHGSKKIAALDS